MRLPLGAPEALPTTVDVGGRAFTIAHDFRAGIRFETMMYDPDVPEDAKPVLGLGIWYGAELPDADPRELMRAALEFYRCGKPEAEGSAKRLYDFSHDDQMIYAAFMQAYQVDLYAVEYLHWWRFRAMFGALPKECQFVEAVGWRGAKPGKGMSAEQKRHMRRMKKLYALPDSTRRRALTDEEYEARIAEVVARKVVESSQEAMR